VSEGRLRDIVDDAEKVEGLDVEVRLKASKQCSNVHG
jgi:hypothetical protein